MKFFKIIIGLVIIGVAAVLAISWKLGWLPGRLGATQNVVIEKGENLVHLSHRLVAQGIIKSERGFRWYVNLVPPHKPLQRGEFALQTGMSVQQAIFALTEGKPIEYKFTVPEGHNIYQIAESLKDAAFVKNAKEFLDAVQSPEVVAQIPTLNTEQKHPRSIEGYIFPDTYLLQKIYTPKEIALIMLARFKEVYKELSPEFAGAAHLERLHMNAHDVITLASIVEKETGAAVERPLIASVFLNRMQKRMRLQTDPTIIYGILDRDGKFDGNIRRKDIHEPTAYNTYVIPGLPPGPIASPGISAIKAVLHPAQSEYLFFVSRNNGTHIFTSNFRDHSKAIRETQLPSGARDGKSWRDLPKAERAH